MPLPPNVYCVLFKSAQQTNHNTITMRKPTPLTPSTPQYTSRSLNASPRTPIPSPTYHLLRRLRYLTSWAPALLSPCPDVEERKDEELPPQFALRLDDEG